MRAPEGSVERPGGLVRLMVRAATDMEVRSAVLADPVRAAESLSIVLSDGETALLRRADRSELEQMIGAVWSSRTHEHLGPRGLAGPADTPSAAKDPKWLRCPRCGWKPEAVEGWRCSCGKAFDAFAEWGKCRHCGRQWEGAFCLKCRNRSFFPAWRIGDEPTVAGFVAKLIVEGVSGIFAAGFFFWLSTQMDGGGPIAAFFAVLLSLLACHRVLKRVTDFLRWRRVWLEWKAHQDSIARAQSAAPVGALIDAAATPEDDSAAPTPVRIKE